MTVPVLLLINKIDLTDQEKLVKLVRLEGTASASRDYSDFCSI